MTVGFSVGADVETLISTRSKVVGATKAVVSSVAPSSSKRAVASGLSFPVTASVRSSTSSSKASDAVAPASIAICKV